MIKLYALVASVGGIGYVGKGGGTLAAIAYCIIWFFLPVVHSMLWQVIITIALIVAGTWSSNMADEQWGKDSSKVVIDEVAGMSVALLFVPHNAWFVLISLVAFRFFDIVKPLGIQRAEKLPKGWGVMADDILAGIYALSVIHLWILLA